MVIHSSAFFLEQGLVEKQLSYSAYLKVFTRYR